MLPKEWFHWEQMQAHFCQKEMAMAVLPIQQLLISPLLFGNLRALLVLPLFIKDSYSDFAGHGSFAFWNQSNRKLCLRYLREKYLMK